MSRRTAALLLVLLAAPAGAATVAEQAAKASADLLAAVDALKEAQSSRDSVAALTRTITAYEQGLAALREALRAARLRETTISLQFDAKSEEIARLLAVLMKMEAGPVPLLLLHPDGPLGTARSGMILSDIAPSLQAEAQDLRVSLQEMATLRAVQEASGGTLTAGLQAAQAARTTLSQAISDRTRLPNALTEDPQALRTLLENAETLDAFAAGLALSSEDSGDTAGAIVDFPQARGQLQLPVTGTILLRPGEADAAGVRRPGMSIATRPRALVTSPWGATIRYRGPLLDYGNVIILEPGGGYLLVMAGPETVYGDVGDVIAAGDPLGLMGGAEPEAAEFLVGAADGTGVRDTETLYLELRQGADPVDPTAWFAATAPTGD